MSAKYPHLNWKCMDVRDLSCFEDKQFDVVVEKACLDIFYIEVCCILI